MTGNNGPVVLMRHTLERVGIDCADPEVWWDRDRRIIVEGSDRLALEVAEVVQAARWRPFAKQRATLRGLEHGRDEHTMAALIQNWSNLVEAGMLGIIHFDSVYTPDSTALAPFAGRPHRLGSRRAALLMWW